MGLIVGGTLFGGLMLLPDMATIVDQDTGQSVKRHQTAEEVILAVEQASPEMDREEQIRMIAEIMNPADADPKLTKALQHLSE